MDPSQAQEFKPSWGDPNQPAWEGGKRPGRLLGASSSLVHRLCRKKGPTLGEASCENESCSVQLFTTLWTVAHQAPRSLEFYRQEY